MNADDRGVEDVPVGGTLFLWSRTHLLPEVIRIEKEHPQQLIEGYRVQKVLVASVLDGTKDLAKPKVAAGVPTPVFDDFCEAVEAAADRLNMEYGDYAAYGSLIDAMQSAQAEIERLLR